MSKITILIIAVVIIFGAWFFLGEDSDQPKQPSTDVTTDSTTDTAQITTVVQAFMKSTLGTLSNGQVDLEMAKELLLPTFAQQLPDLTAVPIIYGIQQGPDDISVGKPQIVSGAAIIDVDGLWGGEVMQSWTFELIPDPDGLWKISSITPAE